jgi:hypothetical protein
MNKIISILSLALITSCSTFKPFEKEKICSRNALSYLKLPKNKTKRAPMSPHLNQEMLNTQDGMQLCYEDFKRRTGKEEFQTCMVVGVDQRGKTEYFDFSSKEASLDKVFLRCAQAVTKKVPYPKYGKNYILIQSYNFYNGF